MQITIWCSFINMASVVTGGAVAPPPPPVLPLDMVVIKNYTDYTLTPGSPQSWMTTWWKDGSHHRERMDISLPLEGGNSTALHLANCSYETATNPQGILECQVSGGPFQNWGLPLDAVFNGTTTIISANGSVTPADVWYVHDNQSRIGKLDHYYMTPPYVKTVLPHRYQNLELHQQTVLRQATGRTLVAEERWMTYSEGAQNPALFAFPRQCRRTPDPMMKCAADTPTYQCHTQRKQCTKCPPLSCPYEFYAKCAVACNTSTAAGRLDGVLV